MSTAAALDLAAEYEALLQFLYLAPVGLTQTSLDGDIVFINPISAQLLMPLARDGRLSNLFTALENVAPDLRHLASGFAAERGTICDALKIRLKAATRVTDTRASSDPETLSLSLLKLEGDRLMAVLSDVTMQVKRERLLRQNEAWLNAILTGITDYAVISLDSSGCVVDCSATISRVTGFGREAVIGHPYSIFYPADATTPDRMLDSLKEAEDNGWSLDHGWRMKADGTRFWGSVLIAPMHDDQGRTDEELCYCMIIRDITDKREASESQRKEQSCDHLTGIANRRAFFEAAELELERCKRSPRSLALIIFDVDHFKAVNDRFGHPAGDAVLKQLADTLVATFREIDVVARIGGEEFAALLPSTSMAQAAAVANRLRRAVEGQLLQLDGHDIRYTLSGGVAVTDSGANGLGELMKRADLALYDAKAAGRNRVECRAAA